MDGGFEAVGAVSICAIVEAVGSVYCWRCSVLSRRCQQDTSSGASWDLTLCLLSNQALSSLSMAKGHP